MKTTIDIADELLRRAKQAADRGHTTLKAVVEDALRQHLADRGKPRGARIKPVVVRGTTPPEVFRNLHQHLLDTYDAYALERLKRASDE